LEVVERRAAKYKVQLVAGRAFQSIVSKGTFQTPNTYAEHRPGGGERELPMARWGERHGG
jgi:hypothetical protein